MTDDPYLYPGTQVLRNKLGIEDAARLDGIERQLATQRIIEGAPAGNFNLEHLRAIHRHLFQDVYEWAGEVRTVEIAKGGHQFQLRRFIEIGLADVHRRLAQADFLRGRGRPEFAAAAAVILGDVNYVHPFREGNGRTQLLYLEQLAAFAGHAFDLTLFRPRQWIEASRQSHSGDYGMMAAEIERAIIGDA